MSVKIPTTTAALRTYFRTSPDAFEALSEAARKTVSEGARGRVHPDAVKAFNSTHRHNKYVEAANSAPTTVLSVPTTNAKGVVSLRPQVKPAAEVREVAILAGLASEGSRGRLSAATRALVGAAYLS